MKNTFTLQNPWRESGYTFPQEVYIDRNAFKYLLKDLTSNEITVVLGARQVGKTFLIKKLIEELLTSKKIEPKQIFYFNFDAFDLVDLITNVRDFLDFLKYYGVAGKRAYIFLDEAQRIPEIGLVIKGYYDLGLDLKFIISGSSSLQIKSQVKETLTGRKHLFELYPLSFEEFLRYRGLSTTEELERIMRFESVHYQECMEEFVLFGGYPGVVKCGDSEEKIRLLSELYHSYVQKDISDFLKIEDVAGFNRLVQFTASQAGGLYKINEVAKNVRLSRHFVERYLFSLEETYVVALLRPYFVNLGKALIKTPKCYFCDTGTRNIVFGQFETLDKRSDTGLLVENFIFSELIKSLDRDRIWFYRTTTGSEIDFLFIKGDQAIAVEVKYSIGRQKTIPKIFRTRAMHTRLKKAIVITKDYMHETEQDDVCIVFRPAWSAYNLVNEFNEQYW